MEFNINKGIGKSVEFQGLKAQYIFIFVLGLFAVFVLFVILHVLGVWQWLSIGIGLSLAFVLVWLTFRLNEQFGEHGLMKLMASKCHPNYLVNRKLAERLFQKE